MQEVNNKYIAFFFLYLERYQNLLHYKIKNLTKNKDIIDSVTFTIDCPDYLIQLSADKESHIPLPIMFITEKVNN